MHLIEKNNDKGHGSHHHLFGGTWERVCDPWCMRTETFTEDTKLLVASSKTVTLLNSYSVAHNTKYSISHTTLIRLKENFYSYFP